MCCWSGTCAICLEDFMIHSNANSSLVSSFCGSCFWWYEVLCLVMFFCLAFFESHAPKWAALVPILTHLDHRISYFWIQGSLVNSEYCSCSSVLFIHSKRMPRKAHFSFVLFFLLRLFRWSSLNQCFLQCRAFVLMLLSLGLGIMCRKSIDSAQKSTLLFQGQLGHFYAMR